MAAPLDVISPITIANYQKTLWYNLAENDPICRMLIAKGNINDDMHGTSVVWPIEAGRHDVYTVSDFQDVSSLYTPRKRYTQASLPWGEIASFRAISKGELRQNGGPQALVQFGKREIPADRPLVAYCHHGIRSLRAVHFLREHDFPEALSLQGGIDAWSRAIDPSVPRY